ncbi:MAG: hypothetical protein Q9202_005998 [Teloschistes flavicans]
MDRPDDENFRRPRQEAGSSRRRELPASTAPASTALESDRPILRHELANEKTIAATIEILTRLKKSFRSQLLSSSNQATEATTRRMHLWLQMSSKMSDIMDYDSDTEMTHAPNDPTAALVGDNKRGHTQDEGPTNHKMSDIMDYDSDTEMADTHNERPNGGSRWRKASSRSRYDLLIQF